MVYYLNPLTSFMLQWINPLFSLTLGSIIITIAYAVWRDLPKRDEIVIPPINIKRRQVFSIILLVLGILSILPAIDAINANPYLSYSDINRLGLGPTAYPTICNISNWASSLCNGFSPIQYENGTGTITITSATQASTTITFPTPFSKAPTRYGATLYSFSGGDGQSFFDYHDIPLYSGLSVYQPVAESFDKSVLVQDVGSNTWSQAITPSSVNEFAVVILVDGLGTCPGATGYSVSDDQGNVYTQQIALCDNVSTNALIIFTAKLSAAVSTTITTLGGGSSQFGGVIALYKGVGWVGNTCNHKATALSDSCTLTTQNSNEFVVGATALDVFANGLGHIDTITPGTGQTQRQYDATNAIPFGVVNYDLEDKQVITPASTTYSSSYNATDGDAIAAIELKPEVLPEWSISSSYSDIYNVASFDSKYTIPAAEVNGAVMTIFFVCTAITNPALTYTAGLFANNVLQNSLGPIAGSTLCNGSQVSISLVVNAGSSGPWTLKLKSSVAAGNDFALFPSIYMIFKYQVPWNPIVYVCSVTSCAFNGGNEPGTNNMVVVASLNQLYTSNTLTIKFRWWAESP